MELCLALSRKQKAFGLGLGGEVEAKAKKMNDLVVIKQTPKLPEKWDYDVSVKKVKGFIYKWKNLTEELVNELYIARDVLSEVGNPNWNKSSNSKTWSNYCQEIGTSRQVANRWIARYFETPKIEQQKFLDDRKIVPYGENIYFLSNKFQDRPSDFVVIKEGDQFPTLKRRSWFFHEDGREFSLREYARVQDFPDTFKFVGTYEKIKDQIGNAVSPKMARYVGKKLEGKTFGDLFAGCGGLSCGLEQLGKKAIWAVEMDMSYARTYKLNHPNVRVITRDIKMLKPKEFENVDIIVGGPPCQGFSLSGKRMKGDSRNFLYKEFLRFVERLKPNEFLMENVPQIREVEDEIKRDFENIGYNIETFLVKGEEIGMRQKRHRYFFVGKRL